MTRGDVLRVGDEIGRRPAIDERERGGTKERL